ncbi:hypothetical protein [Bacillus sp. B-jedd]|uniref:hypothetical protein n=1 Tax=Bacillus sp. B-jedd TaxID=1476857 RepID=UPI0005156289|nr:hypothetical protein [Bacillus sp. B-jedd]CEG28817.1 cbiN domain protein [Bacillus sp. B-jedd]
MGKHLTFSGVDDVRKLTTFVLYLCLSFIVLMAAPNVSYACKCIDKPPVEQELKTSSAVFSGKVIEIREEKRNEGVVEKVLFEVNQTWKGPAESQIILESIQSSCSFTFRKGMEYIVYAVPNSETNDKTALTTGVCDRTALLENAEEDLKLLGDSRQPTKEVNREDEMDSPGLARLLWIPGAGIAGIAGLGYWIWRRKK